MTKSNEPSIEQMNEAIALFDGWLPNYGGQGSPFYSKRTEFIPKFAMIVDMKYHTSWDWLMPVWYLLRTVISDHFDEDYPAEYCSMCDVWALYCEHVNINGAHRLLHDAITWFNQQKQNNG